jgi:GAF domain-containing protein
MTNANQNTQPSPASDILNSAAFSNRWRETFLKIVLRASVLLGGIMFVNSLLNGDMRIHLIYGGILLVLSVVTFAPVPYAIRAGILSLIAYLIGTTILLGYGVTVDASMFLLAFVTITALLFDYQAGIVSLVISAATLTTVGWLALSGTFKLFITPNPGLLEDWITNGLDMVVPAAIITLAVYFLKREFNLVLQQVREIFGTLQLERTKLEDRIAERTADLTKANRKSEEQAIRLRIVAEVSRSATAITDQDRLLNMLTTLISQRFGYYHVGIFLVDELRDYAFLSASNSEGGKKMLARGHRLQIGQQGIVGYVTSSGQPRIALDVGADAVFFDNPDLPETHSEMCLPLKIEEVVIGALDIQSKDTHAFTDDDYSVLSILADQVAIAIQNARGNEEIKRALQEAEMTTSQLTGRVWKEYTGRRTIKGYQFRGIKAEPLEDETRRSQSSELTRVPIRLRGEVIGSLKLRRTDAGVAWNEDELALARATADRVALAIENARLLEDSLRRANKERIIGEISTQISSTPSIESILRLTAQELGKVISGSEVTIQLEKTRLRANE